MFYNLHVQTAHRYELIKLLIIGKHIGIDVQTENLLWAVF